MMKKLRNKWVEIGDLFTSQEDKGEIIKDQDILLDIAMVTLNIYRKRLTDLLNFIITQDTEEIRIILDRREYKITIEDDTGQINIQETEESIVLRGVFGNE